MPHCGTYTSVCNFFLLLVIPCPLSLSPSSSSSNFHNSNSIHCKFRTAVVYSAPHSFSPDRWINSTRISIYLQLILFTGFSRFFPSIFQSNDTFMQHSTEHTGSPHLSPCCSFQFSLFFVYVRVRVRAHFSFFFPHLCFCHFILSVPIMVYFTFFLQPSS